MRHKTTTFARDKGATQMANVQASTEKSKGKETNGAKPEAAAPAEAPKQETAPVAVDAATDAQKAEAGDTEGGKRGVMPTMPMAIVYREGNRVYAAIHHPMDGSSYIEAGKGEGSAIGALVDSGFRLSNVTLTGPEWLRKLMPAGATLIGFATIKSFPLPEQPK